MLGIIKLSQFFWPVMATVVIGATIALMKLDRWFVRHIRKLGQFNIPKPVPKARTERGRVEMSKIIRYGVIEVGLINKMNIDPELQQGNVIITGTSFTTYVHFHKGQTMPRFGDVIEVTSTYEYDPIFKKAFNWVESWKIVSGPTPVQGHVSLRKPDVLVG